MNAIHIFIDSGNRNSSLNWNLHIHLLRSTKRGSNTRTDADFWSRLHSFLLEDVRQSEGNRSAVLRGCRRRSSYADSSFCFTLVATSEYTQRH